MDQTKQEKHKIMLLVSFLSAAGVAVYIPVIAIAAAIELNPWAAYLTTAKVVAASLVLLVVHARLFRDYGGAGRDIIVSVSLQSLILFLFVGALMFALWPIRWVSIVLLGLQVIGALNVAFWFYALARWLAPDIREACDKTARTGCG